MPITKQNGMQRLNDALTKDGSSKSSLNGNSRFDELISQLKGNKISKERLREEIFYILLDDATEAPQTNKYYIFEYDPKFRDQLTEWDEFPLVYAMEFKKDNLLGANLHYISRSSRLRAINNKKFPKSTLRYYIPKRADRIFFEIQESEVQLLSTLPLEKFHRNR